MLNQISSVLSDEAKSELLNQITALETKMTFLKPITKEQISARQNLGDSLDFVLKGINTIKLRPEIMPGTFLPEEYKKDLEFHHQLYELQQKLAELLGKVNGTMTWLGQDMMSNTNEVYDALQKGVKNDLSLQPLLDEMTPFYAKAKAAKTAKPSAPSAQG
jgi:hypothetical protein